MACVVMQKDCRHWFSEVNVDMEKLQEICRYLISFYDILKGFDEKKEIPPLLAKIPKPKLQPSRYKSYLI